jgi:hypothetical protein
MAMFRGFNQASRAAAPNLLAASAADERAAVAKRQQITNLALGAASLASPFFMPAAAAAAVPVVGNLTASQINKMPTTNAGAQPQGGTGTYVDYGDQLRNNKLFDNF